MERMRDYLAKLTTGWNVEQVRAIVADTLTELISPLVYEEATALITEHRALRDVRAAEVTAHDAPEIMAELRRNRLVEVELRAQPGDRGGVGALAHHLGDRVAGDDVEQQEGDYEDTE